MRGAASFSLWMSRFAAVEFVLCLLLHVRSPPPYQKTKQDEEDAADVDYETLMNMLRTGQYLSPQQTIDLASQNLEKVWYAAVQGGSFKKHELA